MLAVYPTNDHDDDDDNDGGDLRRSEEVPDDHNELAISEKHAEHAANESSDPQPAAAIQHHDEHETVKEHETHDRHSDDDSRHTHETHEEKREHEHHKTAAIQHAGENDEQRPHQHHDAHSDDANEAPVALETTHDTEAVAAKQHSPSPPPPQQHQDEDKKHEISAIAGDTKREATPSPPPPAHTHVEAHEEHEEQQEARPTEIAAGEHVESSSSRSEGQHEAAAAFHHHDQQEKDAVDEAAAESRAKTLNDYTSTTIIESEQRSPTPPTDVVGPRRIHDDDSFAAAISHLPRAASDARPPSPSSGAVTVDKASETALLEEIRDSKHVELQPANEAQSSAPLEAASTRSVAGSDDYKEQSIETNASKPTDERAIEATNAQKKHEPADDADATAAAAKTTAHATPAIVADNAAAVAAESGAPLLPTSNAAPIASGSKTTTADERQTTVAAVSTSKIEETSGLRNDRAAWQPNCFLQRSQQQNAIRLKATHQNRAAPRHDAPKVSFRPFVVDVQFYERTRAKSRRFCACSANFSRKNLFVFSFVF